MAVRKDAGLALAKFCVDIDERFPGACGPRTVWTTGSIRLDPGAPSIIPGSAEMLFQMRDADVAVIERLETSAAKPGCGGQRPRPVHGCGGAHPHRPRRR